MNTEHTSHSGLLHNLLSLFSVALLLITLGAAFGTLAGLGPMVGMISTAILCLVTALVGGTRYGISSLTGPMTAAVAVIFASKQTALTAQSSGLSPAEILSLTVIMAGVILFGLRLARLDRIVQWAPNLVISGFMNGIAVLVILSQIKAIELSTDWILLAVSFQAAMIISRLKRWSEHPLIGLLASSFVVIVVLTVATHAFQIPVTMLSLDGQSLTEALQFRVPAFPPGLMWVVLPLAFELAIIALLDTLLTGVILEKESKVKTQYSRELTGQSISMILIGLISGVPGAQSTVPSMMFWKEEVNFPWAKILLAGLVILMTVFLLPWIEYVPVAVLAGLIFKISVDLADFTSLKKLWQTKSLTQSFLLLGTLLSTVFLSLNMAVIGFTLLFVFWNKILPKKYQILDLKPLKESEGLIDEL